MIVVVDENEYVLEKNYKEGFFEEDFKEKYTDYFEPFDYIFGDYSYDSLRLKGFYKKQNKNCRNINCIDTLDSYIKDFCSYDCRYFLLKKVKK